MKKIILFFALCVGLPMLAVKCLESAHGSDTITINHPFAYPSIGAFNVGIVFFEIENETDKDDAIIGAESTVSDRVELHTHVHDKGLMRMRKVDEIALPADRKVTLQRGGLHIMLFDLKRPLIKDDTFPLTLKLKSGKTIPVTVKVESRD